VGGVVGRARLVGAAGRVGIAMDLVLYFAEAKYEGSPKDNHQVLCIASCCVVPKLP
jgi:hypothetical protein